MVSPEAIQKAKALIDKNTANYVYFFGKVSSAEWVQPLRKAGFFLKPPEGGVFWPETRYLVRVAEDAPEPVYEAVMKIPQTENVAVHRDLIAIAMKLPEEQAAAITLRFLPSFRKTHFSWIDDNLCELIGRLAAGRHPEQSLTLAKAVLEVLPQSLGDEEGTKAAAAILARCGTHLRPYEYETCAHRLTPPLANGVGFPAVMMFGGLLSDAIRYEDHRERGGPEDFSTIWVPAFDQPVQRYSEPKAVLAHALSQGAEIIMGDRPKDRAEVLTYLRHGPYKVFRRIEIHLLRLFPDGFDDRINEVIGNRTYYADHTLTREYQQLVAAHFPRARSEVRTQYLSWAEEFFDFPKQESELRRYFGDETPAGDIRLLARQRALARIAGLRESLPPNWQARYDDLVKEVGEPDSPHALPHISEARTVGPTSPKTVEQLRAMNNAEIIAFLREWKPPPRKLGGDWLSPEGIGRQLQQVAKESPSRFTEMVDDLKGLDPTYVRSVIEGLQSALGDKGRIEWEPAVRLCLWVIEEGTESQERARFDFWQDRDWGGAKGAAVGLFESGLRSQCCPLPIELRDSVWRVIRPFTESTDPSPDDDKKDIEEGNSLLDRALNTRRGRAMETVIHYALWLRRHFERSDELKPQIDRGFEAMPEVRDVLDRHLDRGNDPSPAIRTVYGEFFPWLVLLDENWARAARSRIFTTAQGERELRYAAWGAYVLSFPPYDKVVDILREEYLAAISSLVEPWPVSILRDADPDGRLAEHLVVVYGRGAIAANDELWQRLWQTGASAVRAHALSFIGRTIDTEKGPLPKDIHDRFVALAGERIVAAEKSPDDTGLIEEMRALGWWFANKAFDAEWAINNLKRVLDLTGGQIEAEFSLAERLGETCKFLPASAATCLRKMVTGTSEVWGILGQPEHIRTVLRTARDSGEAQAVFEVRKTIDALVSKGFYDYRDLLAPLDA